MSNHDTPEPYEALELQSIVDGELARVDMEDKYGRIDLKHKVLVCIARQAEAAAANGYVVTDDDMAAMDALLDDLATIEKEGW